MAHTRRTVRIIVALLIAVGAAAMTVQAADEDKAAGILKAVAVVIPTKGNSVSGVVTFEKVKAGVRVQAQVSGLTPGKHGFHIHQWGDCSAPDGKSAGGHFNPQGVDHGGPETETHHIGDLGNIVADADGNAAYDAVLPFLKFSGRTSIIGRGIIIHAGTDDLTSQPTGAAGARVACAVIGVAKD